MTTNDLLEALARLRVETGSLACLGCGREHNCSTHGCAILRAAADLIEHMTAENAALREKQRWIPVTERLPEKQAWYHVAIRDKKTMRIAVEQDLYSVETAKNFGHEIGFCKANRWPEREELIAWMPLPEAPEEGNT